MDSYAFPQCLLGRAAAEPHGNEAPVKPWLFLRVCVGITWDEEFAQESY